MTAADGAYSLDMDASPGNLAITQTLDDARPGESYTLSFAAADPRGNNEVEIWFGGEYLGSAAPTGRDMVDFTFEIEGGAGDGSNMLEFREVGPSDNSGTYLDAIEVR